MMTCWCGLPSILPIKSSGQISQLKQKLKEKLKGKSRVNKMFGLKNKLVLLFIVLLIHNTCMDLFSVVDNSLVVLWEKSIELKTIITHSVLVVLSVLFYLFINKTLFINKKSEKSSAPSIK